MGVTIDNKAALVTGGARGIGAAIVFTLAAAGVRVMIADIGVQASADNAWRCALANESDLEQSLSQGDGIKANYVDVTGADSCTAAVAATIAEFGQLDMLINNAGIVFLPSIRKAFSL